MSLLEIDEERNKEESVRKKAEGKGVTRGIGAADATVNHPSASPRVIAGPRRSVYMMRELILLRI